MIAAFFLRLWGRVWPYLAAAGALAAGIFAARQAGKAAGKAEVEQEQAGAVSEQRRRINEADNELVQMDRSDIRDELRKWVQPVREDEDR